MGNIRPFLPQDIEQVVYLYGNVFLSSRGKISQRLKTYFHEIFFHHPWPDEELESLVYEDEKGTIIGFLGVLPRRMRMGGKQIRVAISSQLIVDPGSRSTLAGVELLKAFLLGPQDLSMADGANDLARKVWEGLGGKTAHFYSVQWTRVLRPSSYWIHLLRGRKVLAPIEFTIRPICRVADAIVTRLGHNPFRQSEPLNVGEELTATTLVKCLSESFKKQLLRPEYDEISLDWLLDKAAQKKRHGELRKVLVRDKSGHISGWYLYYSNPGGISEVLQVGAKDNHQIHEVLAHLFYDAWRRGAIAVSGRLGPEMIETVSNTNLYPLHRNGPWCLIHSNRPELLQAICSGEAFLSRLEGEWWMAFQGEEFQ